MTLTSKNDHTERYNAKDAERKAFKAWYAKVDANCAARIGLGIDDLADGASYDAFLDGVTPAEYVDERLDDEGFGGY